MGEVRLEVRDNGFLITFTSFLPFVFVWEPGSQRVNKMDDSPQPSQDLCVVHTS
jgi:hypothetical protein